MTRPLQSTRARLRAAAAADTAAFLSMARAARDLEALDTCYAAMSARHGFAWHELARREGGRDQRLAGCGLPVGRALELQLRGWAGAPLIVRLGGRAEAVDAALRARLTGIAAVYGAFAEARLDQARDVQTSIGLGLMERQCLAQLLGGRGEGEIAAALDIAPVAVAMLIDGAVTAMGVATRSEAVALAARRGWLAALPTSDQVSVKNHG